MKKLGLKFIVICYYKRKGNLEYLKIINIKQENEY